MPMRVFIFLLISVFYSVQLSASELEKIEEQMAALQNEIAKGSTDEVRTSASEDMKELLILAFDEDGVFDYPFDKAFMISTIKSPDNMFRFFNWSQPLKDGSYIYYAFVLFPGKGEYVELKDTGELSRDIENKQLAASDWYGALYYEILPVELKKETYYIIMGWNGNDILTNKKVLDVLSIGKKNKITLGKAVFETHEGMASRIVLEYAEQARVNLRYMESKDAIIYDRLEPEELGLTGNYAYYVPSTAYNGYKLNKLGTWDLIEYLDMSRPKSEDSGLPFNFPDRVKFDRHRNNINPQTGK